jgi:hypothetical protein
MRTNDDYALREANKAFNREYSDEDNLGDISVFVLVGAALVWFFANY